MGFVRWMVTGVLILCVVGNVLAAQDVETLPGYVDVETVLDGAHPNVEICVKGSVLSVLSTIVKHEEPELGEALSGLGLIRVFVFENARSIEPKSVEKTLARLEEKGWEMVVRVSEDDNAESVTALVKMNDDDKLVGFALFASDPSGDAVFVNIAGELDLPKLVMIGHKFGLPPLTELAGMDEDVFRGIDLTEEPDEEDGESEEVETLG